MGYRNYIALLDTEVHQSIKDKTYRELVKEYADDGYVPSYSLAKEVYEIGKYWEHDFLDKHKAFIFSKRSTNKRFNEDGEFFIIGKDGLRSVIDSYHKKIADYYSSLLNPSDDSPYSTTPELHIKEQLQEWKNSYGLTPYDLRPETECIVSSWKFEYTIFELVRLYKTVDETKHLICLTGH